MLPLPAALPPPRCPLQHKATAMTVQCKSCKGTMTISCKPGMGGAMIPRICTLNTNPVPGTEKCDMDPFQVGDPPLWVAPSHLLVPSHTTAHGTSCRGMWWGGTARRSTQSHPPLHGGLVRSSRVGG
jgi:hypothetical protein